jgi:hypothetical protein
MTNYVFGDLQFFVHNLPYLINREEIAERLTKNNALVTVDETVNAWCEHDALHYLSQQSFDKEGEECVAYLEKTFNRGWLPFGERYNTSTPRECEYSHITQELITQTAEDIWSLMGDCIKIQKKKRDESIIWRYGQ